MKVLNSDQTTEKREDELEYEPYHWSKGTEFKETLHTLISHHPPSQYGHCLRVSVRGRSIYFCARCTGLYGGLALGVAGIFLLNLVLEPSWLWFMVALALGFTTVVDWMTQRIARRKTTNHIRFITGVGSGLGLAIVFLLSNLVFMLITLGVMIASVGLVTFLESKLKTVTEKETLPDNFFDESELE